MGSASIDIVGGREREIHVLVDADKLHATGLSVQQVGAGARRGKTSNIPAAA